MSVSWWMYDRWLSSGWRAQRIVGSKRRSARRRYRGRNGSSSMSPETLTANSCGRSPQDRGERREPLRGAATDQPRLT